MNDFSEMEPILSEIPARNKRQAMDWSLVLTSQEIETTITREPRWALLVADTDYDRALRIIEQYQKENRGWNWRQKIPVAGLVFHWGTIAPCLLLVAFYFLSVTRNPSLKSLGMVDSQAVHEGQWWRIFTAITLHADLPHLIANVTTGFILFGMVMARYGAGLGLLLAFLAGAGGNVAGFAFYPEPHRSLGASGMIMGALGLLGVEGIAAWRTNRATQWFRQSASAAILVLALMGFSQGSDIVAHVGGFVCGAILGMILHFAPKRFRGNGANVLCVFLLVGTVISTWWLALK